ncbi:MAG: hypothetical protein JWM40_1803 [Frankiales bacterium]|nr:hypothetical protein [Frankiales bacterium]
MADHSDIRYGTLDQDFVQTLYDVQPEDDSPFFMLNLMRDREWADYPDGRTGVTGQQADDTYAPVDILADLGAEISLFGQVVAQPVGDERWDRVAMVRYPTVRSFLEMQDRPDFIERHVHKDAGMDFTIIALCRPVSGKVPEGELLVDLSETPHDGPGLVMEVLGTPVGDGRQWTSLRLSAPDAEPVGATAVTVVPLWSSL